MNVRKLIAVVAVAAALATTTAQAGASGRLPARKRYVAAMYNSGRYITDPKLAGAHVERDGKNRPLAYSGSFSTVFKLRTASGRKVAMRVFHPADGGKIQTSGDLTRRYTLLGGFMGKLRAKKQLPGEILEFALIERGLRIGGEDIPILKLPWISGRGLDNWIDTRIGQGRASAVRLLASNWRELMADLRQVGLAHGDLHHGNIKLESSGAMRLLDYDAMYAPPLKGMTSDEIGHPNFQHPAYHFPARTRPFDGNMDNFSSIVIYLSLLAVADDPGLWQKYYREDNLIFVGERDFVDPDSSPVFRDIAASKDARVRNLGRALARYAKGKPGDVPTLARAIEQAETPYYRRKPAGQTP
jgi:hypothetical protein